MTPELQPSDAGTLPSPSSSVIRNVGLQVVGQIVPLATALIAIPPLLIHLGPARFGVLSLLWTVAGYLGIFDLGVGRATTYLVAHAVGAGRPLGRIVWTSLAVLTAIGSIAAVLLWLAAEQIAVALHTGVPDDSEVSGAWRLTAVSLPLITGGAALRAALEGAHRFGLVNLGRATGGLLSFGLPAAAVLVGGDLVAAAAGLALARVATAAVFLAGAARAFAGRAGLGGSTRDAVGGLLSFGAWSGLAYGATQIALSADRWAIALARSSASLAAYAVPYELLTKAWVLPGAIATVLFPALGTKWVSDRAAVGRLYVSALKATGLFALPIAVIGATAAPEALSLWLGPSAPAAAPRIAQWLAIGLFYSSVALIPFTLLQAIGRPSWTVAVSAIELPLFAVAALLAASAFDAEGVAVVWTARAALDLLALGFLAERAQDSPQVTLAGSVGLLAVGILAVLPITAAPPSIRLPAGVIALTGCAIIGWRVVLSDAERRTLSRSASALGSFARRAASDLIERRGAST